MAETSDIQQAKEKLQQVAEDKEARRDPRAGENSLLSARKPGTDTADKNIRPVAAKPKKKTFGQKLKEAMFGADVGKGDISEVIFFRYFIPGVKRVLREMAGTALDMVFGFDPKSRSGGSTHVSNASIYRDRNYSRTNYDTNGYRRRNACSEYEWDEQTAKDIYNQICDLIEQYGECSLADVYSIMGLGDRIRTTDRNWGWTSTRNIDVIPVNHMRDSWIIDLPEARPLR